MSAGFIFIVIFFAIIIVLIFIAVFGSKKSKKEKAQTIKQKEQLDQKASLFHEELYVFLFLLSERVKKDIAEINLNGKSVAEINVKALATIEKMKQSQEVKDIYSSKDRKVEFAQILEPLSKVKPNKWEEEAYVAINILNGKIAAIKAKNRFEHLVSELKAKYKIFSDETILNSEEFKKYYTNEVK